MSYSPEEVREVLDDDGHPTDETPLEWGDFGPESPGEALARYAAKHPAGPKMPIFDDDHFHPTGVSIP